MEVLWKDKKRTLFGLPLSFTTYTLTREKLLVDTGFLNKHQEEIMLYRILDLSLERKLSQRLFGLGTIHCCSSDRTSPEFDIKNVKNSQDVKELLSKEITRERKENRVSSREIMYDADEDYHD